jgi:small subunit ribosomal protein S20
MILGYIDRFVLSGLTTAFPGQNRIIIVIIAARNIEEDPELANHKSALKRNRQSLIRRDRNRMNRSKVKTAVRKIEAAIEVEDSVEKAREALIAAVPIIERAAVKGAYHRKTASRKVSRLTRKVNSFAQSKETTA